MTNGRDAQRRRTRRAIVTAAGEMLADGHTPTVGEIAERADVSPRTVHVHFATLEQLLTDAALGVAADRLMEDDLAGSRTGDDVEARVVALAQAIVRHHNEMMPLGRTIIKLTVDSPPPPNGGPRRGARRMDWIEDALKPARDQLSPDAYDRLAASLAMVIGWEPMLVLWDVLNLTPEQAEQTTVWAARSLVRAAVADV